MTLSVELKNLILWLVAAALINSCGTADHQPQGKKGSAESSDIVSYAEVKSFDIACQETRYANVEPGQGGRLYLKITGASPETHSIGYIAANGGQIQASFNKIEFQPTAQGSYAFDVIFRNRQACQTKSANQVNCDPANGPVNQKESYDSSISVTFNVVPSVNGPIPNPQIGADTGILGKMLSGQGIWGAIGSYIFGQDSSGGTPAPRPANQGFFDKMKDFFARVKGNQTPPATPAAPPPAATSAPCLNGPPS